MKELVHRSCKDCKAIDTCQDTGPCYDTIEVPDKPVDIMALAKASREADRERQAFEDLQHQQPYGWWRNH